MLSRVGKRAAQSGSIPPLPFSPPSPPLPHFPSPPSAADPEQSEELVGEAYFEAMGHPVALAVDPGSGIIYLGFQDTSVRWAAVADVLERTFTYSQFSDSKRLQFQKNQIFKLENLGFLKPPQTKTFWRVCLIIFASSLFLGTCRHASGEGRGGAGSAAPREDGYWGLRHAPLWARHRTRHLRQVRLWNI